MSTFRRIVTGHRADGQSIIARDESINGAEMPGMPGLHLTTMWGGDQAPAYPDDGSESSHPAWFPRVGGVRFVEFILPPDSTVAPARGDAAANAAAADQLFPGLLDTMQPDDPGMHRSATTDMLFVVSGRCVLELDDGSTTHIGTGDIVIQSGTMHRWHNPHDDPCRIIGALVGAHSK